MIPFSLFSSEFGRITIKGPISHPISQYVSRVIKANQERFDFFLITIDTPGGLDPSMREIIESILSSKKPVVCYVYPKGARAASAGAFIVASCHLSAMAPGTSIGAAHPVMVGVGEKGSENSTMAKKVLEDAVSYITSLAKMRGRDVEGYVLTVKEAKSFDAMEAVKRGMVDLMANDIDELLEKIDGRTVDIDGKKFTFKTKGLKGVDLKPTLREKLLTILGDPNIAYMLLLLGFYGIFFELTNPGAILPGVLGGIFLILGLYSLHILPVNYAGLFLILLSFLLFLLEVKFPSHGALTLGGIVSFILGSLFLIENPYPYLRISIKVIIASLAVTMVFFLFIVQKGISALRKRPVTGAEGLIGEVGRSLTSVGRSGGKVFVHGEIWDATSDEDITEGESVEVVEVKGLRIKVRRAKNV